MGTETTYVQFLKKGMQLSLRQEHKKDILEFSIDQSGTNIYPHSPSSQWWVSCGNLIQWEISVGPDAQLAVASLLLL